MSVSRDHKSLERHCCSGFFDVAARFLQGIACQKGCQVTEEDLLVLQIEHNEVAAIYVLLTMCCGALQNREMASLASMTGVPRAYECFKPQPMTQKAMLQQ